MKHDIRELRGGVGHQNASLWLASHQDRKGTDMILVSMGNDNGIKRPVRNQPIRWQSRVTLFLWMKAGVDHQFVTIQLQVVRICSNLCLPGQVDESHSLLYR